MGGAGFSLRFSANATDALLEASPLPFEERRPAARRPNLQVTAGLFGLAG
jgi:hypothetical protein